MALLGGIFENSSPVWQMQKLALEEAKRKQEQEQVQLLGNPYRARLLLGDMQMQNQPTPNFMQVPGGSPMPSAAPRPGLGNIGQDRNLMAMGADPLAVVQNRMSANAAMSAPMKLGKDEIVTNLNGNILASNRMPEGPQGPATSLGKLKADLDAGLISPAQYNQAVRKETYIAPTQADKPDYSRVDYWRGQVKPLVEAANDTLVQSSKVKTSLGLGTGVGHIAAVNALQQQIDKGALVREQDVELIRSAQSFLSKYEGEIARLKSGDLLPPTIQAEMIGLSDALSEAIIAGVNDQTAAYKDVIAGEGVDYNSVLPAALQTKFNNAVKPKADNAISKARAAIAQGADRNKVIERLRAAGIDASGL